MSRAGEDQEPRPIPTDLHNDTEFSGEPMSETERYQLPFILHGRAQKEVYRNEALTRIDAALHAAVEEVPPPTPPPTPQHGKGRLAPIRASGDCSGKHYAGAQGPGGQWRLNPPPAAQGGGYREGRLG